MRRLAIIAVLLAVSGCSRQMNYYYYPGRISGPDAESRVGRLAQKECAKYGMNAVPTWTIWPEFERERRAYRCE